MTPRSTDFRILLGLAVCWGLAAAFVGLGGDFPLNDDWAYAYSTRTFLETGQIERLSWTWAPIVTHVWAGALASHWLGFSFETLRLTGIVFGFAAAAAGYGLGRACGLGAARSLAVAATLAVCPLHFNLSFTFMTDPPFAFWVTASLAALAMTARARGFAIPVWLGVAGIAIAAATLLRQPGAAVAAAGLTGAALVRVRTIAQLGAAIGIGLAVGVASLAVAVIFFDLDDGGGPMFEYLFLRVLANPNLPHFLLVNALAICVYLGWFLAPIAPLIAPQRFARPVAGFSLAMAVAVPLAVARLLGDGPPGVNLIWDFGLGSTTLHGVEHLPQLPQAIWWLAIALGAASGAWFAGCVVAGIAARFGEFRLRADLIALLVFPALYIGVLALRVPFFDRYLTAALPALSVLGLAVAGRPASQLSRAARGVSIAAFVFLALFSVLGTRDYMERHRSRNALLEQLQAEGVSPRRIDGGFEFGGLHNFDSDSTLFIDVGRRWVYDDEFLLTYATSREGYRAVRAIEYRRWLPPGREQIHLLTRIADSKATPRHSSNEPARR